MNSNQKSQQPKRRPGHDEHPSGALSRDALHGRPGLWRPPTKKK